MKIEACFRGDKRQATGAKGSAEVQLILNGFIGAGKTTVGRIVAERLGWPFRDLDWELAAALGYPIAELFAEGEALYRRREQEVLRGLDFTQPQVLAVGGGTLIGADSRRFVQRLGALVVVLDVTEADVLARLEADHVAGRPRLSDWAERYRDRAAVYASFPHRVATTGRTPAAIAEEVLSLVGAIAPPSVAAPEIEIVATPAGTYPRYSGPWARAEVGMIALSTGAQSVLLLSDHATYPRAGDSVRYDLLAAGLPTRRAWLGDPLAPQPGDLIVAVGGEAVAQAAWQAARASNTPWLLIPTDIVGHWEAKPLPVAVLAS